MITYAYAMTRHGEAQHAVKMRANGTADPTTVCGRKATYAYGPTFTGDEGIQHPWRCDICHRKITTTKET